MSKWILARTLTLIGILGAPFGGASAKLPDTSEFASEREARKYLQHSPNGPKALAAFQALSQLRSEAAEFGLSREQMVRSYTYPQYAQATTQRKLDVVNQSDDGESGGGMY